jgi:hypothetical protein
MDRVLKTCAAGRCRSSLRDDRRSHEVTAIGCGDHFKLLGRAVADGLGTLLESSWSEDDYHARPGSLEILRQLFISMDVHKATISIRIAEDGRNGPVRFLGVIPNATEV